MESRNAGSRLEVPRAPALLAGLDWDAKSGVTVADTSSSADRAVSALRDAIKAGWSRPDERKEPDFDPLRARADFQKLVADLEVEVEPKANPRGGSPRTAADPFANGP